jgi:glutamate/tyrosine decarboxylase-like PLP-dependent enzyme
MKFGFSGEKVVGTFTSGGAEANSSAVLVALIHHFPKIGEEGLRSLPAQPVMYVSEESHHSFLKIAHMSGLGGNAVRIIPTDDNLRMNLGILEQQIRNDRRAGCSPFFVVGTAGTTSSGIVDTLPEIADLCTKEKVWFHVDAAWGGAAILSRSLKYVLEGIDRADSITFDAHKWLSVPMGAGMFFCKDEELLWRTFGITTAYMPTKTSQLEVFDPYMYSAQWTRRFIGLKVFMSLAVEGFAGYEKVIDHQTAMGNLLRKELLTQGWNVTNTTPLPVVNFQDAHRQYAEFSYYEGLAESIIRRGKVWISATRVKNTIPVLRACITSYRTQPKDIESLIEELNHVRTEIG